MKEKKFLQKREKKTIGEKWASYNYCEWYLKWLGSWVGGVQGEVVALRYHALGMIPMGRSLFLYLHVSLHLGALSSVWMDKHITRWEALKMEIWQINMNKILRWNTKVYAYKFYFILLFRIIKYQ